VFADLCDASLSLFSLSEEVIIRILGKGMEQVAYVSLVFESVLDPR
jgi:hypothetical protein